MSRFSTDWSELSLQVMITFGHFLWQACVIGFVLFVAQHVVESLRDSQILHRRRGSVSLGETDLRETDLRGANIRYTIACVAFFSLPTCVIATFAWVHQSRGPIVLVASDPVEFPSSPMASANEAIPAMADSDIPVLPPSATPMNAEVSVTEPIEPATLVVEPQTSPLQRLQAFAPYLLLAYIVGVGFMLARFLLSIIGSSRLRRTIQPITDVKLLRTIAEQCARVGLKRVPIVALCNRVSVPVVVGIVKPMILLPPALLCGLDPNQIAAILSHEIAHIRRYDLIVNFLQRIVEALLFFHPVTWWISRRVSIERENCCDDVAAACMGRLPYAGALLQMAELCIGNDRRRLAALATLSATGGNTTDFGYRVRRLIGTEETTRVGMTRRSLAVGIAVLSLLTVSLVAWGQSQQSEKKTVALVADTTAQRHGTGALTGRITVDGVVPVLPKLRVRTPASPLLTKRASDEERKKYEASLVEIDDESILVDADQGLANAFVYLAKAPSNWHPTQENLKPFTLKMQDERFTPRAAIVRTHQDARLSNTGGGPDNFAFEPTKNGAQNRMVNSGSEITLEHPFTIPERIPIQAQSQMNPWKMTFLLPLDHPFAAITDSHGNFSIQGLPPGEHSFLIWHERTGWLEKSLVINIQAGKTTEVDRSYSVDRMRVVTPSAFGDPVSGISIRLQPLVPIKLNSAPPEIAFETKRDGNLDLILSEVPSSENRIAVDGEIYSHSGLPLTEAQPHYRSVKDRIAWHNTLSPRFVMDGEWKSVKDGQPLKLAPGKHVIRLGWGGFHPLGDNPQLPDKTKPAVVWSNLVELTVLDYAEVAIAYDSGLASYDLDTEKGIGPTASVVAEDQLAEFDLRAGHGAAGLILTGQLRKFIKVDNEFWSTVSMKEIRERLTKQNDSERIEPQLLSQQGEKLPSTFIVETNQGAVAILQIEFRDDIKTELSGIVKGFVLRYRLFPIGSAKRIDLSGTRKDFVGRIEAAIVQRDKASKDGSDYSRLNHWVQIKELHLAQFDLENGIAGIDLPDAQEATPERIAELRELLRFRWGLPVDGIQVGIARTDDRIRFTAGEKVPFQIFIRNITQEPIIQSLRWCDARNMTASLRRLAGFDSDKNIYLSPRPNSLPSQPTELRLGPGVTMELPAGRFEMDTVGLHSGVYYVDGQFPVVFPTKEGELATRVANPVDSSAMPHDLLFRFELVGVQPTPQNNPADQVKEVAEYADIEWGKTVYGLQAGTRYRNNDEPDSKADLNNSEAKVEPTQHPIRIGDTIKTEVLVRNVSDQPITVRFHPAAGSEVQLLSAMRSNLTEVASRNIMRRTEVPIAHDSDRTVERTLQPGEVFVAAQQDFEIQLLLDGRERQLDLPKANRHWVKGSGDYTYTAYLKLNITDSLSVSLNSGRIKMHVNAEDNALGSNPRQTSEPKALISGGPPVDADFAEISELIASAKTIPRELNDKYQAVHLNLTAAERLKSVKLLAVPDFVMQIVLSEPSYTLEEKIALLSELKDRNFGKLEFGMQECMENLATEYAQSDPAATREWLSQFQGAEYGVGMGLTAVLNAAKQKDPATSLEILRSLSDAEAECIVTCGDIPKYDLPASDWLKEVQQFQSQRLRSCFLGGPMVFHFGEESPEAALDYILSIPKETRTSQLGYQLVSCVLRSKRFTWTEILDWMETKLPIETRSPEHYGLLADTWSQQDNASFQLWFQELKDPVIRDEAIRGIHAIAQPQDWAAMFALAQQITDQTKRQAKIAWVLDAWKLTDPSAALAQLNNADVSKERRTQLHRDITARLAQVGNAAANDSSRLSHWIPARPLNVTIASGGSAKILDDHSVRLEGDAQWQEASLQFAFDKPKDVQELRLEILPVDLPTGPQFGRGGKELMLFEVKPSIENETGKFTSLDFASCTYLQNPSDDKTSSCIDYLSDTGWKVPKLPADASAHELVLRFEKPITLQPDQRLSLTVDSGGAEDLAVLNRIRVVFRQGVVAAPQGVNSTTSGSDAGEPVTTSGADEKVEPWEISKLYEADFLRNYLQDYEALPKPIVVPAVRGKVFDPDGKPVSGVSIVSHTPRHWVDLDATLAVKPHNTGGVRKSKQDGTFGLPERKEPYRVLFVHESGVANVSHEELLRANGIVTLQKWASVTGTVKRDRKPQAGEKIILDFDTLPWSYSRGGPRLTTTHRTTTDKDGNFSFDRVPPLGGVALSLRAPKAVYECKSGKNTHIEIGAGNTETHTQSDNHDHHHDEVSQKIQPDGKPQLPRLIVKTVDTDGKPVPDIGVLFYDRNSQRAGQKQKFEMISQRTSESGVADFGVMPNSFGCLQLSSNKELAGCYTLISASMTKCTQGKPERANVQTEIKDGILTVTFTMTPHVDLEFNIVDDSTNEIVFWSEIFYQDPTTNRWWQFGLVDGSQRQHNFIPISPQITRETIRISALGYETKVFRLPDELDRSQPIRRDIRLKPMPDVELKVVLPEGTLAEKAKLTFQYPNELDCLQDHELQSDTQGIVTTKFPPNADIGILRLEHTGGTAELSMQELLDAVKQNPGKVVQHSIQLVDL